MRRLSCSKHLHIVLSMCLRVVLTQEKYAAEAGADVELSEDDQASLAIAQNPADSAGSRLGMEDDGAEVSQLTDSEAESPEIVYKAEPLSTKERLVLRRYALKVLGPRANFNVGTCNSCCIWPLSGLRSEA